MKTEIDERGILIVSAKNSLESFALKMWSEKNINQCTGNFKEEPVRCFYIDIRVPKITLFHRIILRFKLFFYR
jgi:hypothetical protein